MSVEMDQFKELYLQSARDHLQQVSDLLLKLESNPADTAVMEEIMRTGHSLKGESGAMGYEQIASLGHVVEDLFTAVGNGSMKMENGLADVLFEAFDHIGASLDAIASGQNELPCDEYVAKIKGMTGLKTEVPAAAAPAPTPAAEAPATPAAETAPVIAPAAVAPAPAAAPTPAAIATPAPPEPQTLTPMPTSLDDIPMPVPQVGGPVAGAASSVLGDTAHSAEALGTIAHEEKVAAATPPAEKPATTNAASEQISSVTLKVDRLDQMIAISEELVLLKMRLKADQTVQGSAALKADVHRLDRLVTDLQFYMMQARLFPISMALHTIPRLVRDVSRKTGKKVRLEMEGEETTVDRTIIDHLTEPFVHLIRNAIDHGIEEPTMREAIGKPAEAVVKMASYTKENKFFVEISDDGRGIEWEKLGEAAIKKGALSREEVQEFMRTDKERLLFLDGVSTSEEITDISGRGVGMSAVRSSIKKLGGDITIDTEVGKGTVFTIKLPMTLAIMQALLAGVGDQTFALPANEIIRTVQLDKEAVRTAVGTGVTVVDDQEVFLFDIASIFGIARAEQLEEKPLTVVLVHRPHGIMGCLVDKIISEEEILVKQLGPLLKKSQHFSGATILANGSAAPIINFDGITWKK